MFRKRKNETIPLIVGQTALENNAGEPISLGHRESSAFGSIFSSLEADISVAESILTEEDKIILKEYLAIIKAGETKEREIRRKLETIDIKISELKASAKRTTTIQKPVVGQNLTREERKRMFQEQRGNRPRRNLRS